MSQHENCSNSIKSVISTKSFYGSNFKIPCRPKLKVGSNNDLKTEKLPRRLNNLFGPTQIWKIFRKQSEALAYAKNKRNGVMTFAFQQWDGTRAFLVCHPKIFWHYDVQKVPSQRCTYEIVPELCACKLYFDLEFEIKFNLGKKGCEIVDTFICIVLYFLSVLFNIRATREDILNLDSSTDDKFSRHLIFILQSHVFSDNKSVGEFVCFISKKIQLYLKSCNPNITKNVENPNSFNECKCCQLPVHSRCLGDIGLPIESLRNLTVLDRKGNTQLICDCSVYSRNRHFRLFQNTKWRKNAPLLLSEDNKYFPKSKLGFKVTDDLYSETLFLNSLITNVEFQSAWDVKVIFFENPLSEVDKSQYKASSDSSVTTQVANESFATSPYPEIDNFINSLVSPGQIRRNVYFCSSGTIVYDIIGYRYCEHIKRQHRSNNVKYIVNLNTHTYYQKCYDPDCSNFRSTPIALPPEVQFQLDVNSEEPNEFESISNFELVEAANAIEDLMNDPIFS